MDIGGVGGAGRRIYGVVVGVVTDNKHPEGEYRVKVKFPWIRSKDVGDKEDFSSSWARISTQMAGLGRGLYLLPEVDDEVLVMFEHGDVRRPIIIGTLWNGKDLPPVNDKAPADTTDPMGVDLGVKQTCRDNNALDGKNTSRFFYSRSGHLLLFDDKAEEKDEKIVLKTKKGHVVVLNDKSGNESIAIYDSTGEEYLYIDEKNKKITLETKNGDIDVFCKNGTFNLDAKNIKTHASQNAEHKADQNIKQESGSATDIKAGADVTVKGAKIKLN
jgi:uncharacterized protein involved in type VI secretion and phage assembly